MDKNQIQTDKLSKIMEHFGLKELDSRVLVLLVQAPCDPTTLAKRLKIPRTKVYEAIHRLRRDRWIFPVEKRGRQLLLRAISVPDIVKRLKLETQQEMDTREEFLDEINDKLPQIIEDRYDNGPNYVILERLTKNEMVGERVRSALRSAQEFISISADNDAQWFLENIDELVALLALEIGVEVMVSPDMAKDKGFKKITTALKGAEIKVVDGLVPGMLTVDHSYAFVFRYGGEDQVSAMVSGDSHFIAMALTLFTQAWKTAKAL